ncbi:MAG TPA: UDP-N-acetylmuramate--L-alanine ligase [Chitinophagaceae bacterium]|jgi:UDP-N-acetylmuramate--alanine ligase|nr:UDP-N-acetylmuramate--L-alanine ligase [Chitinophagaceae bacterium]
MSNEQPIQATTIDTLEGVQTVYFIGIGGIGMSALARYFQANGVAVSGYDKTPTDLTRELEAAGIAVHYEESADLVPREADLVVYTPAVPRTHAGLVFYQENGYRVVKRSDVLQAITRDTYNICIAGTHGKTTITTLTGHILRHSGYGCTVFLGGISVNYGTNFWSTNKKVCVVEADEYDRSFHKLSPDIAVVTAMDADHLDIYGDERSLQDAFIQFENSVREEGQLIAKFGLPRQREVTTPKITYSLGNEAAGIYASGIRIEEGGYRFHVHLPGTTIKDVELRIGGMHNVENTVAAIAVAHLLQIDEERIRAAVRAFAGVRRRFEYILPPAETPEGGYIQPVFIDDYAHHPEELAALLKSVRSLFPQRRVTVVFQPHLYSRTRDLADGFARSLSIADTLILLPIYPARELPIEGVSSELILEKAAAASRHLVPKESLVEWMEAYARNIDKEFGEVIVTAGAGDIDTLIPQLKKIIENA